MLLAVFRYSVASEQRRIAGIQSFDKLRMHGEPVEPWIPAGVYPVLDTGQE